MQRKKPIQKETLKKELFEKLEPKEESITEIGNEAEFYTVNVGKLKDFFDYGMNKSMNDLKLARNVDVRTREDLMKKKPERDLYKLLGLILLCVIVGVIAFMLITQVLNYNDLISRVTQCEASRAYCQQQLSGLTGTTSTTAPVLHG